MVSKVLSTKSEQTSLPTADLTVSVVINTEQHFAAALEQKSVQRALTSQQHLDVYACPQMGLSGQQIFCLKALSSNHLLLSQKSGSCRARCKLCSAMPQGISTTCVQVIDKVQQDNMPVVVSADAAVKGLTCSLVATGWKPSGSLSMLSP